jgi:hypothetical protein
LLACLATLDAAVVFLRQHQEVAQSVRDGAAERRRDVEDESADVDAEKEHILEGRLDEVCLGFLQQLEVLEDFGLEFAAG